MALGDDMVRGSVIGDRDRLSDIVNGDAAIPDRRGMDDCFSTIPLWARPMRAEDASESTAGQHRGRTACSAAR
jgi:hypothetical protein